MEKKKKYCSGCDSEQYIWKNFEGNKYCKNCWGKIQSKDPDHKVIPQVSAKRKKLDAEYLQLRAKHLEKNPLCEIKVAGCTNAFYLIQSTWAVTCRSCHRHIHDNPAEARTMGWLK